MSGLLNTSSVMMCPHGGTVSATTTNSKVKADGSPIVRATDTYTIAGCPFMLGTTPHPCMQVQWVQPDARSKVVSDFTLSEQSVGLCAAGDMAVQGTVSITSTQAKVKGI